jgi:RecA-family ATPase
MLAADPGVGKSLLALSVCQQILTGDSFWDGHYLPKPDPIRLQRVLWVEAEAGEPFHMARAERLGINPLHIIEPRLTNADAGTPSLNNAADRELISDILHHPDVVFAVVDSLSAASAGVDENSSAAGQSVAWLAEQARNTNKPILVIHHMNKSAMRTRGSAPPGLADIRGNTAIAQHARIIWTLDNPDEHHPARIRLACAKSNLAVKPQPQLLEIIDGRILLAAAAVEPRAPFQTEAF